MCVCVHVRVRIANEINWFIWNCSVCPTWATYFKNTINEWTSIGTTTTTTATAEQKVRGSGTKVNFAHLFHSIKAIFCRRFDFIVKHLLWFMYQILFLSLLSHSPGCQSHTTESHSYTHTYSFAYTKLAHLHTRARLHPFSSCSQNLAMPIRCSIRTYHNKENWIHKRENFTYWQSEKRNRFALSNEHPNTTNGKTVDYDIRSFRTFESQMEKAE